MKSGGGSTARRVLTNSAVLAVSKVLERTSGFVVGVLVANQLGAAGLGVFAAAWALYGLIAVAAVAGTTDYLVREISRDPERTAAYTTHLSVVAFGFALVVVLASQVVVRHVGYSAELESSVSVMLLAVVPKVLNGIQEGVFVARGRVAFQTMTRFWSSMAYVAAAAWMLAHGAEVVPLLWAFVALEYGVAAVYFALINRYIVRLRPTFRWRLATRLMREMKAFTGSSLIAALFARPEIVLLSLMATEQQVGFYSAALRVVEIPLTLGEVLMVNVFPIFSQAFRSAEERFAAWQTAAVRVLLTFTLFFSVCCLAAAEDIVRVLYGSDFGSAAAVLRILAVSAVFGCLISVFWRSLVARGRQDVNLVLQAIAVGVRLATGVALIATSAAIGAALSSTFSSMLHLTLLVRATARSGVPPRLIRVAWRFVIAAAAGGIAMWALGQWLPALAVVPAGALLYGSILLALGAITPEDRSLLRRTRASLAHRRGTTSAPKASSSG
jgi:O-antigen/teichoic acid export membrane protein